MFVLAYIKKIPRASKYDIYIYEYIYDYKTTANSITIVQICAIVLSIPVRITTIKIWHSPIIHITTKLLPLYIRQFVTKNN